MKTHLFLLIAFVFFSTFVVAQDRFTEQATGLSVSAKIEQVPIGQPIFQDQQGFIYFKNSYHQVRLVNDQAFSKVSRFPMDSTTLHSYIAEDGRYVSVNPTELFYTSVSGDQQNIALPDALKGVDIELLKLRKKTIYILLKSAFWVYNIQQDKWSSFPLTFGHSFYFIGHQIWITDILKGIYIYENGEIHLSDFQVNFRKRSTPVGILKAENGLVYFFNRRGYIIQYDPKTKEVVTRSQLKGLVSYGLTGAQFLDQNHVALSFEYSAPIVYNLKKHSCYPVTKASQNSSSSYMFVDHAKNIWWLNKNELKHVSFEQVFREITLDDPIIKVEGTDSLLYADGYLRKVALAEDNFGITLEKVKALKGDFNHIFLKDSTLLCSKIGTLIGRIDQQKLLLLTRMSYRRFEAFKWENKEYIACFGPYRLGILALDPYGKIETFWFTAYNKDIDPEYGMYIGSPNKNPQFLFHDGNNIGLLELKDGWNKAGRSVDLLTAKASNKSPLFVTNNHDDLLDYKVICKQFITDKKTKAVKFFKVKQEVYAWFNDDIYKFDAQNNKMVLFRKNFEGLILTSQAGELCVLTVKNNMVYKSDVLDDTEPKIPFPATVKELYQLKGFFKLSDNITAFYSAKSIYLYDQRLAMGKPMKVKVLNHKLLSAGTSVASLALPQVLAYGDGLRLEVGVPLYNNHEPNKFRYRLNKGEWSEWSASKNIDLIGLNTGRYLLEIEGREYMGARISRFDHHFRVAWPWYLSQPVLLIYLLLILFIYRLMIKRVKKKNRILEIHVAERTRELNRKNAALSRKNIEIKLQSDMIEEGRRKLETRNGLLEASINYASRVQKMFTKSEAGIREIMPKCFLFSKAKDKLTGDFFWIHKVPQGVVFALADCTGHGVPSALLTMYGRRCLEEVVVTKKQHNPALILLELQRQFLEKEKHDHDMDTEGLEIGVVMINVEEEKLYFSGANINLFHKSRTVEEVFKGNRFYIGTPTTSSQTGFTCFEADIEESTEIFLATDGYSDQFGGPRGRKMMVHRQNKLFSEIHGLDANEQGEKVRAYYKAWRGAEEAIDDAMVIGCKPYALIEKAAMQQQSTTDNAQLLLN